MYDENSRILQKRLTPVFGKDRVSVLYDLSEGFGAMLSENPMTAHLSIKQAFPMLAVAYGHAIRTCNEVITDPESEPAQRESAEKMLAEMQEIVSLLTAPEPVEEAQSNDAAAFQRFMREVAAQVAAKES